MCQLWIMLTSAYVVHGLGIVPYRQKRPIDVLLCFEEASRIGIKTSFIKIAGVFGRGESTGAILAVRINKRHAAGME